MKDNIKIKIYTIDDLREKIDFNSIVKHTKGIFEIDSKLGNIDSFLNLSMIKTNADKKILKAIKDNNLQNQEKYDFTVYLTNYPLEGNYYMRRCADKLIISTNHLDLEDYFFSSMVEQENFIIKCLYEAGLMWLYFNRKTMSMSSYMSLCHEEDIGCIFDFNMIKKNVHNNMLKPFICSDCKKKLLKKIDKQIIYEFDEKLSNIGKPSFYALKDWCVYNPWKAFLVGSIIAGFMAELGSQILNSLPNALMIVGDYLSLSVNYIISLF